MAVLPKDHPLADAEALTLDDLAGEPLAPAQPDSAMTIELVAAGTGHAIVPQGVARLHHRRDVVAVPVTDAAPTRIALVWRVERDDADIQEFVGVVRGRTARSSRGDADEAEEAPAPAKGAKGPKGAKGGGRRPRRAARAAGRSRVGRRRGAAGHPLEPDARCASAGDAGDEAVPLPLGQARGRGGRTRVRVGAPRHGRRRRPARARPARRRSARPRLQDRGVRGRRGRRQPLQRDDARGRRSTRCSGASRTTSPASPRPRSNATIPLLFTCYGIGVLTRVLGGTVGTRYGEDAAAVEITLTARGRRRPARRRAPPTASRRSSATRRPPSDCPTTPCCSRRRAGCPVQVYRVGRRVYATQFHPEVTASDFVAPRARVPSPRLLPRERAARGQRAARRGIRHRTAADAAPLRRARRRLTPRRPPVTRPSCGQRRRDRRIRASQHQALAERPRDRDEQVERGGERHEHGDRRP